MAEPTDACEVGDFRTWLAFDQGIDGEWLELRWEAPVAISQVQLIHDAGLHHLRCLSHSHSNRAQSRMVYGRPQPESLRAYAFDGDGRSELLRVDCNWQRRCVHDLSATMTALRLRPLATKKWFQNLIALGGPGSMVGCKDDVAQQSQGIASGVGRRRRPSRRGWTRARSFETTSNGIDHARLMEIRVYTPLAPRWTA